MEKLEEYFQLPMVPHDFQYEAVEGIVTRDCSLLRFKVGLGKTYTSLLAALWLGIHDEIDKVLIICPPILIDQWVEFLSSLEPVSDDEIGVFRGTPKQKNAMKLEEDFIVVSYNIFRSKDYFCRFDKLGKDNRLFVIADELSMKDMGTQTYRRIKMLLYRKMRIKPMDRPYHRMVALNATPISDPDQVYNWCSVFVPGVYKSKMQFKLLHYGAVDNWNNVLSWKKEDLMSRNMELFSINTDKEIILPELIKTVVPLTMNKSHRRLYEDIKEAQIDGVPPDELHRMLSSIFSTLQRVVLQPEEFGLHIRPPVLDYIDTLLDQLEDDDGVIFYTRHVAVSKMLHDYIPDCGAIYGDIGKKQREQVFEDLSSGKLKRLVGNLDSIGHGLNLQMLTHLVFVEFPFRYDKLEQSIGRVHRQGQTEPCFSFFPMVNGTVQEKIYKKLLYNGVILERIIKTKQDLIDFLS